MNASTSSSAVPSVDDVATGYTVIGYAIDALAAGITLAIAWSCSSVLMGLIMFIVMGLVMYLLSYAAFMLATLKLSTATVGSIGHSVGGLSARITGLFNRKATPVAA